MQMQVKRVYDEPAKSDGTRVLIDRLWPRGVRKEAAQIDLWLKEATPSNELRQWVHADKEAHFPEFEKRYLKELKEHKKAIQEALLGLKKITLITAVKDVEHSHVPVLVRFLETMLGR